MHKVRVWDLPLRLFRWLFANHNIALQGLVSKDCGEWLREELCLHAGLLATRILFETWSDSAPMPEWPPDHSTHPSAIAKPLRAGA